MRIFLCQRPARSFFEFQCLRMEKGLQRQYIENGNKIPRKLNFRFNEKEAKKSKTTEPKMILFQLVKKRK